MKIFLESCEERSKLSVHGFGGRRDHLVAQQSNFKILLQMHLPTEGVYLLLCGTSNKMYCPICPRWYSEGRLSSFIATLWPIKISF